MKILHLSDLHCWDGGSITIRFFRSRRKMLEQVVKSQWNSLCRRFWIAGDVYAKTSLRQRQ